MKNLKKLRFIIVTAVLLLFSCSKSDSPADPINITGGAVFRSQLVTITLPDTNMPENEYQATLDGVAVTMTKSEDNKLLFLVPFTTTIGLHDLVIPAINNATIHYDIKDMELTDTPEVTMSSFSTNLGTFSQTLDTSVESVNIQNSIASFNAVFDHASSADKTKIAILYKANKAIFDDLVLNDFSNITGKISLSDVILLHKHTNAVMVMAIGAVMTIGLPTPIEKCLGIILIEVGAKKAIQFFHQLELVQLETITMNVNDVDGVNNRGTNGVQNTIISLQDNAASALSFNTKDRGLITTDASSTQTGVAAFFKIYNKYNYFGDKVNTIITFVNANVPFANFSLLKLEQLPTTSAITSNPVNAETFSHITFSISNPNLSLISATLQSDGLLSLKVKIIGTPATTPVVSNLNYTFNDGFTSFTGKLPIEVNADFVITSVSILSWTNIGVPCPTMNKSGEAKLAISFNNSAPTNGVIKWSGDWDNQNDGVFEGIGGSSNFNVTDLVHSGNEIYLNGIGCCWGLPTTVLRLKIQYISPTGYQSNIFTYAVPRP